MLLLYFEQASTCNSASHSVGLLEAFLSRYEAILSKIMLMVSL